jgi:hypothetical protein
MNRNEVYDETEAKHIYEMIVIVQMENSDLSAF